MTNLNSNKIFCIGLSRTGTVSLCTALERLGLKTTHFPLELFAHPHHIDSSLNFKMLMQRRWLGKRRLGKELKYYEEKAKSTLNMHDAFGDLPIPNYYKLLDKKYPGSKFILTIRNERKWLNSMKWMLTDGKVKWKFGELNHEILYQTYGTTTYNEKQLLTNYIKHNNDAIGYFKKRKEDLLVLNLDKGDLSYPTLCKFLQYRLLEEEFPKSNSAEATNRIDRINYFMERKVPFYTTIHNKLKRQLK